MPGLDELGLERERAADDERYEVVAPVVLDILHFGHQLAVLVDAVAREVGGDVAIGGADGGLARAGLRDLEQRAGLGVALCEQQEVVGLLARQHDEVRLRVAGAQAARRRRERARTDQPTRLHRRRGKHLGPNLVGNALGFGRFRSIQHGRTPFSITAPIIARRAGDEERWTKSEAIARSAASEAAKFRSEHHNPRSRSAALLRIMP
mgnify:CR=1 FL=1